MDKEFVAVEQITKQVLIYPSLDYTLTSPSMDKFAEGYLLDKAKVVGILIIIYKTVRTANLFLRCMASFIALCQQTMVLTAAYDPLQDEGAAYYSNVVNIGVNAELMKVDGVVHAYLMLENLCTEECNKTYQKSPNS